MADQCSHCGRWSCRPTVVDGILVENGRILLIRRAKPPFEGAYAIPGGYVDRDEDCQQACEREVLEETGLKVRAGALLGAYDSPARDPERQNISLVYEVEKIGGEAVAGDDANALGWFPLDALPELAFDHAQILADYKAKRAAHPSPTAPAAKPKTGHSGQHGALHAHHGHGHGREITCRILSVSDTRQPENDYAGTVLRALLQNRGHRVLGHSMVRDDLDAIRAAAHEAIRDPETRVLITTGGSGIAPRDVTPEALSPLLDKTLPGFGEAFRQLSFQEVGAAAYLSRAMAGTAGKTAVYCLPGSLAAVILAVDKLILPELPHLVALLDPQ